jgi:beta-aspartyl-dipeptidase (metallo-type)
VSLTLLQNADVYAPEPLGHMQILVGGGKILAMGQDLGFAANSTVHKTFDLEGRRLIPGLIDCHAHLTGGGGESGFSTRVPRLALSTIAQAGVTTIVGLLGTDGTTRSIRDLVACTYALREEGLSAYCYTGSYQFPPPTLTGSVRDDIVFIEPVLGVGELALSDHRSSQITLDEFLRLCSDAYAGGLISAKAGVVHLHLGDGDRGLDMVRRALDLSEIPARIYHPTHVNRRRALFEEAQSLAQRGVTVDVTAFPESDNADELSAHDAIVHWLKNGLPVGRITCSSDGAGCLPIFDDQGGLEKMDIGRPIVLPQTLAKLLTSGHSLNEVLPVFTSNVARVLRLPKKGQIKVGCDADLVVLDEHAMPNDVMASGNWLVREQKPLRYGTFEGSQGVSRI